MGPHGCLARCPPQVFELWHKGGWRDDGDGGMVVVVRIAGKELRTFRLKRTLELNVVLKVPVVKVDGTTQNLSIDRAFHGVSNCNLRRRFLILSKSAAFDSVRFSTWKRQEGRWRVQGGRRKGGETAP